MIIGSLAESFCVFSSCNSFMAFSPIGVAALSKPNRLAEMHMKIEPVAGWSFGIPGKSLLNTGAVNRAKACITPPFSPIFMMPRQRARTPVSPRDISNPVFAEAKEALMIWVKTSVSPPMANLQSATTKAIRKKAIQI